LQLPELNAQFCAEVTFNKQTKVDVGQIQVKQLFKKQLYKACNVQNLNPLTDSSISWDWDIEWFKITPSD